MYETEQLLVNEIKNLISIGSDSIPNDFKKKNQILLTEVNLGFGIADIVLTECEEINEIREDFLTTTDINIFALISMSSGISISEACAQTKCSKTKVQYSANKLIDLNYVKKEDDLLIAERTYRKAVKQSIAIEVKLKNWKRALKQAYRYKWFSEKSFVCLPHSNIKPAIKNIHSFQKINVGLIELSPEGGMNILYDPGPNHPISEDMAILLNENVLSEINGYGEMLPKC